MFTPEEIDQIADGLELFEVFEAEDGCNGIRQRDAADVVRDVLDRANRIATIRMFRDVPVTVDRVGDTMFPTDELRSSNRRGRQCLNE